MELKLMTPRWRVSHAPLTEPARHPWNPFLKSHIVNHLGKIAEPCSEGFIFFGKEKEDMGRAGYVLSMKLNKELRYGIHGPSMHTHTHTNTNTITTITIFSSRKNQDNGEIFSFKGREHRGKVQESRKALQSESGRRALLGPPQKVRGIWAGPWGWGETPAADRAMRTQAACSSSQTIPISSEWWNTITEGTGKMGRGTKKATNGKDNRGDTCTHYY